jgi:hypothetical protein
MAQITTVTDVATATLPAILGDLDALIDRKIRNFLAGNSDGGEVLETLYGDTIYEPVPARLIAILGSCHDAANEGGTDLQGNR